VGPPTGVPQYLPLIYIILFRKQLRTLVLNFKGVNISFGRYSPSNLVVQILLVKKWKKQP